MSKFLRVPNGDYKIEVQDGGEITLDTGLETGRVRITGDLIVEGERTDVYTTQLNVEDNIIEIAVGNTNLGAIDEIGIRFTRPGLDGKLIWDENIQWTVPADVPVTGGSLQDGGFVFSDENGSYVGIRTNSITTGGGDLYLINQGSGVISVTGTANYEDNVTDDDHVPNKKFVDDAITTAFATLFQSRIGEGTVDPTFVEVFDREITGSPSNIQFGIDNQVVATFYDNRFELDTIRIQNNTISTIDSNEDLTISAPGVGSVKVDDTLQIMKTPGEDDVLSDPAAPTLSTDGVKLYVKDPNYGDTGIYFVNSFDNRDEIISTNRALLYSMLF